MYTYIFHEPISKDTNLIAKTIWVEGQNKPGIICENKFTQNCNHARRKETLEQKQCQIFMTTIKFIFLCSGY